MKRLRTWWRGMGGLMAACLLAMLVTAPVFDALICSNDEASAASVVATAAGPGDVAAQPGPAHKPAHPADVGGCQHGHCHHGTPMLGALVGDAAAPLAAQALQPGLSARAAPSLPLAGPDSPPRA